MSILDHHADEALQARFQRALERFVEAVKADEAILGAVLCGSLSHDRVWEHSDIDMVLISIDDKKIAPTSMACTEDGVNIHAEIFPRAKFRQIIDGTLHNSFMHSLLAKGRLLYTHDPSITAMMESLAAIGERDTRLQLFRAGTCVLPAWYKAQKWFITRRDLQYATVYLLQAANSLAQVEIISRGLLADREVLPQAMALNPEFFRLVYHDRLIEPPTEASLAAALDAVDTYLGERTELLFQPLIDFLDEADDLLSVRDIDHQFKRQYDVSGASFTCEYLADKGIIGKAAISAKLTKVSTHDVQELAFYSLQGPPEVF